MFQMFFSSLENSQLVCPVSVWGGALLEQTSPCLGPQMGNRSTFMVHFYFIAGRKKPENMEGGRSLLLILIMAACFYGNGAQGTGGGEFSTYQHTYVHQTGMCGVCVCLYVQKFM